MLRLAGCSSGTGVCARGGCPARRCVSLAAFCARHRPALRFSCGALRSASLGFAFLLRRFALGIARPCVPVAAFCARHRPALRSCRGALPSASPVVAFLSRRFALGIARRCVPVAALCARFTPAVCRLAPNRTACGILRSWSAGSRSPIVRSRDVGAVICLCGFTSGLAVSLWRSRRGCRGTRGNGATGAGGAAFVPLCVTVLALQVFPRGERWGCAPQTAPKSLRLSGLSSRCGGAALVRIRAVTRVHG